VLAHALPCAEAVMRDEKFGGARLRMHNTCEAKGLFRV
jgi:hypothetical protein